MTPDTASGPSSAGEPQGAADAPANACCEPLQARLDAAEDELARLREDSLRERADLENQRRRVARDVDNARRFANERLLGDLLPVIDSLEAGLAQAGEAAGPLREGMELTLRQLLKMAGDHGLAAIDPVGKAFDPERHQAMAMVPAPEGLAENHVVQVYQKGWLLNERLLRPALVVVSQPG